MNSLLVPNSAILLQPKKLKIFKERKRRKTFLLWRIRNKKSASFTIYGWQEDILKLPLEDNFIIVSAMLQFYIKKHIFFFKKTRVSQSKSNERIVSIKIKIQWALYGKWWLSKWLGRRFVFFMDRFVGVLFFLPTLFVALKLEALN